MNLFKQNLFLSICKRCYASLSEQVIKIDPKYLYEPKIINTRKYPDCATINVRLQMYDFVPLEKYQSFVVKIAKRFKFNIIQRSALFYAVAAQNQKVITFKPNSTKVVSEINLSLYDRWIQLDKVPCVHLPFFIQLIQTHAPVGIIITIKEHEKEDEKYRYIPDLLLIEKQKELKSLDDPAIRKLLGWE